MYAGLSFKKQYLLQITDSTLKMFSDTRIKAACNRTGCLIAVYNRILTRKLGGVQAMRFCIFEIKGPNEIEVEKCNRIIEKFFPEYKLRKNYNEKEVAVRLKVGLWTPDNTNLYFLNQRYGVGKGRTGDLQKSGPEDGDGALKQGNSVVESLARSLQQDWPGCSGDMGGGGVGGRSRQRSISQGARHRRYSGPAAAAAVSDEELVSRYMGFREQEAILKNEIKRLESYLCNLPPV